MSPSDPQPSLVTVGSVTTEITGPSIIDLIASRRRLFAISLFLYRCDGFGNCAQQGILRMRSGIVLHIVVIRLQCAIEIHACFVSRTESQIGPRHVVIHVRQCIVFARGKLLLFGAPVVL
jgi:hypothetical protein